MTAKEYLRQVAVLDMKIERRIREIEELKAAALRTGGTPSGSGGNGGSKGDRLSVLVAKWADMEKEVTEMIDSLVDTKHRILGEIESLGDGRYVRILTMRYVDGQSFEQIAVTMGIGIRQVFRLHGHALQEFERSHLMS